MHVSEEWPQGWAESWIQAPGLAIHRGRQADQTHQHAELIAPLRDDAADAHRIRGLRDAMFAGNKVNPSEGRAAGHWALRLAAAQGSDPHLAVTRFAPNGEDLIPRMTRVHAQTRELATRIRSAMLTGDTGRPYRHIIHLGIGGSDLGPRLLIEALQSTPANAPIDAAFLSNLDYHAVQHCLAARDPRETLVVIASKSFTTQETLINAAHLRQWMLGGGVRHPQHQMIAITNRTDRAAQWEIPDEQILWFDESIGGRFSLWGPVSLTSRIVLGNAVVDRFIEGGIAMDRHFTGSHPLTHNLPAVLAVTDFFNLRSRQLPTLMVSPYDSRLALLVPYLKQLWMESLGKQVDAQGRPIEGPACPILWGDVGTNAQHAFFQLLHQGQQGVAVELIGVVSPEHEAHHSHHALLANLVAQAQALSTGLSSGDPQRDCRGGHPVNLVMLDRCDAYCLGSLIALWEHRVVCLAALTGINPFDQWGVELGKSIAHDALKALSESHDASHEALDSTSRGIIAWLRSTAPGPPEP